MKNSIRVTICVMLVVAVLAMSLSVFADEEEEENNPLLDMNNDTVAFLVWQLLDSWGIDVQYQNIRDYNREVQQVITDWIVDYLSSQPSVESVVAWVADWYFETDFWGNLVVNQSLLDDVQSFADWLAITLGLTDNQEHAINPVYTLEGYNLYNCNQWYSVGPNGRQIVNMKVSNTSQPVYYFIAFIPNGYHVGYRYVLLSPNVAGSINNNTWVQFIDSSTTPVMQSGNASLDHYLNNSFYHSDDYSCWQFDGQWLIPEGGSYFTGSWNDLRSFISTAVLHEEGDIKIITGQIALPADNPDYSQGDSMTIIDGQPFYSLIDWDGHVTVDNLPAVISQGTVSNPGLETFWGFIPVLAEQTKEAIVLTRGLIYELPEELVVTFYAVMGGLILFGVIKLMREH